MFRHDDPHPCDIDCRAMSAVQQSAQQQAMANTNDLFNRELFGKRNFAVLDDIYTRDARILPAAAEMISGRDAIREFWSDLVQSANATSAVLASLEVMPAGTAPLRLARLPSPLPIRVRRLT